MKLEKEKEKVIMKNEKEKTKEFNKDELKVFLSNSCTGLCRCGALVLQRAPILSSHRVTPAFEMHVRN